MILLTIEPAIWVLIGMIVVPIIVFKILSLKANGFFDKFKRKK